MSSSLIERTQLDAGMARPGGLPVPAPKNIATLIPAPAMVLLAVLSVQLGAAIAKPLLATHSAFTIVLLRFSFATMVLSLIAPPRIRHYSKRQWLHAAALGIVMATLSLTFYQAISRIPLGVTMTIQFLGPLTVAVAVSRQAKDLVWPGLAVAGILLLAPVGNLGPLSLSGLAFAFLAAAAWGTYLIIAKRTATMFSGTTGLTLAMTFAAVTSLPFGFLSGGKSLLDFSFLASGFGVSLLATMIPFSLEFLTLKRMSTRTFGVLMSAEPSTAALIGLAVLHEHLALRAWAALALVTIATVGVVSQDAKGQKSNASLTSGSLNNLEFQCD